MVNSYYEKQVDQLIEVATRFAEALTKAGIEYRIIGGLAIYFHVNEIDPLAARLTRDIDAAVRRSDIERIACAVEPFGFQIRHVAGLDMLVDPKSPTARSAVHLVFVNEKVRSHEVELVPEFSPVPTLHGLLVAPVADLVRMKLTSFRLKDRVHIQDMDGVGLITPEIESALPEMLRERLAQVRATE